MLETVLSTILGLKQRLNITGYSHFCLRDADPAAADSAAASAPDSDAASAASASLYYRFGLLHTDYTPKPAFAVYQAACRAPQA